MYSKSYMGAWNITGTLLTEIIIIHSYISVPKDEIFPRAFQLKFSYIPEVTKVVYNLQRLSQGQTFPGLGAN